MSYLKAIILTKNSLSHSQVLYPSLKILMTLKCLNLKLENGSQRNAGVLCLSYIQNVGYLFIYSFIYLLIEKAS